MFICIAGKNRCSVEVLKHLLKIKFKKKKILVLPNNHDNGKDDWQPSLKRYAKNNDIKILNLHELYKIEHLYFFSLEYEKIIDIKKFKSKNLFNFHFSLLPKYRGCHTNYLQLVKGEKHSGVTLHKINSGIDTGDIVSQYKFKIKINDTALDNYERLMSCSIKLFKKSLTQILKKKYTLKKQKLSEGSYFDRKSVNYNNKLTINLKKASLVDHNRIRSLIFPAYQYPFVNGSKIVKSVYKNKKIYLTATSDYKSK